MKIHLSVLPSLKTCNMQTFLPYASFEKTAKCLDYRRLGKQRVEAMQILNILENKTDKPGWRNHPAVLMWKGYENALRHYFNVISTEWVNRGYKHNIGFYTVTTPIIMPPWIGNLKFHETHQSNLVRKKPEYYIEYFGSINPNLEYIWP